MLGCQVSAVITLSTLGSWNFVQLQISEAWEARWSKTSGLWENMQQVMSWGPLLEWITRFQCFGNRQMIYQVLKHAGAWFSFATVFCILGCSKLQQLWEYCIQSPSLLSWWLIFQMREREDLTNFQLMGIKELKKRWIFFLNQFSDLEPFRSHLLFLQSEIRESFKVVKN